MSKVSLIIQREYLVRVKKKSFLIMSLVGPILIAALMIVPAWLATREEDSQKVEVIDESGLFINKLKNTENIDFEHTFRSLTEAHEDLNNNGDYTAVLHIPKVIVTLPETAQLFYKDKPKGSSIRYMEGQIAKTIENKKLEDLYSLSLDQISGLRPRVKIVSNKLNDSGESEESADELATGVGLVLAMFIYFFIFLFGVQVMRGVIEEKTNRIVEVIISSVKPFQLMMGKIIGIALVALTQVALWIGLSSAIVGITKTVFSEKFDKVQTEQVQQLEEFNPALKENQQKQNSNPMDEVMFQLSLINFPVVIGCFVFFFIGGYLLYGSLFAAIGSAVDNETDTQQFMMPVTIPLIIGIVIAQVAMENPDGSVAFWASIIPFTSPIVMMVRVPFGVAEWEIALSMVLLIATFIGSTMMAGKIYRTGILMYGKKINFKEIGKWLFFKG